MGFRSFDAETYLLFPLFGLGAAASLGLIGTDILPFIDLGETFAETGGITWTYGRVLSAISLLAVMYNRQASLRETSGIDLWVAYATLGLIIAPPFFPALSDTLAQQPASWLAFTVQSIGFAIVTYLN